jgi:hypothetical protein
MEGAIFLGLAGVAGVVACELMALHKGVNGKRLATSVAVIALIAGYAFGVGLN